MYLLFLNDCTLHRSARSLDAAGLSSPSVCDALLSALYHFIIYTALSSSWDVMDVEISDEVTPNAFSVALYILLVFVFFAICQCLTHRDPVFF